MLSRQQWQLARSESSALQGDSAGFVGRSVWDTWWGWAFRGTHLKKPITSSCSRTQVLFFSGFLTCHGTKLLGSCGFLWLNLVFWIRRRCFYLHWWFLQDTILCRFQDFKTNLRLTKVQLIILWSNLCCCFSKSKNLFNQILSLRSASKKACKITHGCRWCWVQVLCWHWNWRATIQIWRVHRLPPPEE